jgi:transcriptional regulator with XRE-family HTH domain
MLTNMGFQQRVSEVLKAQHVSQATIARRINVHPSTLGRWISGESRPTVYQAWQLARELGVSLDYLLSEDSATVETYQLSREEEIIVRVWRATRPDPEAVIRVLIDLARDAQPVNEDAEARPTPVLHPKRKPPGKPRGGMGNGTA